MEESFISKAATVYDLAEKYGILEVYPSFSYTTLATTTEFHALPKQVAISGYYDVRYNKEKEEFFSELSTLLDTPVEVLDALFLPGFKELPFPGDFKALRLPEGVEETIRPFIGKITLIYIYAGDEEEIDNTIEDMLKKNPTWSNEIAFIGINIADSLEKAKTSISKIKTHKAVHYWMDGGGECPITSYFKKVPPAYFIIDANGLIAIIEGLWGGYPERHIKGLMDGKKTGDILPIAVLKDEDYANEKLVEDLKEFIDQYKDVISKTQHFIILGIYMSYVTKTGEVKPKEGFLSLVVCFDEKDETDGTALMSQFKARFGPKMEARAVVILGKFRDLSFGEICTKCAKGLDKSMQYLCTCCNPPVYLCANCVNNDNTEEFKEPAHEHPLYYLHEGQEGSLNNLPGKLTFITDPKCNVKFEYGLCGGCNKVIEGVYWKCLNCAIKNVHVGFCTSCLMIGMQGEIPPTTLKLVDHSFTAHVHVREVFPNFMHEMAKP